MSSTCVSLRWRCLAGICRDDASESKDPWTHGQWAERVFGRSRLCSSICELVWVEGRKTESRNSKESRESSVWLFAMIGWLCQWTNFVQVNCPKTIGKSCLLFGCRHLDHQNSLWSKRGRNIPRMMVSVDPMGYNRFFCMIDSQETEAWKRHCAWLSRLLVRQQNRP